MRILFVGAYDPAAQLYLTAKALRDHLGWDAHSVITTPGWLEYENDWVVGANVQLEEVVEFAKTCDYIVCADLLYLVSVLVPVYDLCTPKNSCLMALGTPFRSNMPTVLYHQIHHGTVAVVPPMEVTQVPHVISTPLDHLIVDLDTIDSLLEANKIEQCDTVTICHATVADNRGRELYEHAVERLQSEGVDVKLDVIRRLPWKDTILRKAKAHITLDSVHIPIPGLNCMEGLYLGHEVVSKIDPWCYMVNPDLPVKSFHPAMTGESLEDGLHDVLLAAINHCQDTNVIHSKKHYYGRSHLWVEEHNGPKVVAQRWKYFINWAMRRAQHG